MSYIVQIDSKAEAVARKWLKSNPTLHIRFRKILKELADHPRVGIGHPEALRNGGGMVYSRRLSAHDRIIYKILDEEVVVIVIGLWGHYGDK